MQPDATMRLRWLIPIVAVAVAACSSDDATNALDPMDEDGVPDAPDAAVEPLPDLGDEPATDDTDDAGVTDAATKTIDAGAVKPPAPAGCTITAVPKAPYLKYGLHPAASDALAYLKVTSGRITQTIGNAAASAGTHAQDGTSGGHAYSAATDLSVLGMTDAQVSVFLDRLTEVGFVPYYRKPGYDGWPSTEARHIHAVWAGAPMKLLLRNQVRDWHVGKNGLASHTTYKFKTWSSCWRDAIWKRYLTANPAVN